MMTSGFDRDVEPLMQKLLASNAAGRERLVTHIDAWMKEQEDAIKQSFASVAGRGAANVSGNKFAVLDSRPQGPEQGPTKKPEAEACKDAGAADVVLFDDLDRAPSVQLSEIDNEMLKAPSLSHYSKARGKIDRSGSILLAADVKDIMDMLKFILHSMAMQISMGVVISLHICFMVWQADHEMQQAVKQTKDRPPIVTIFEVIFNFCYTLELVLKLVVLRRKFFFAVDRDWNLFDGTLVFAGWFDIASQHHGAAGDVAQLRILRLFKMLRIFRMFQLMRGFKELRLIVASMLASLRSTVWAVLLILAVCFMFGILFVQASSSFLKEANAEEFVDNHELLTVYWGSVHQSILSLFIASMGGADWIEIADSLKPVGSLYFYLFLVYIGFFFTVVTNTLTSLFVESAMVNSDKDKALVLNAELEQRAVYVNSLKKWYHQLDKTGDGKVSLEEFMDEADSEEMIGFCIEMDISLMDVQQFFMVLSSNGRRAVDLETFVLGCIKLRGPAKSLDVMDLFYEHKGLQLDMKTFMEQCEHGFERLDKALRSASLEDGQREDGQSFSPGQVANV